MDNKVGCLAKVTFVTLREQASHLQMRLRRKGAHTTEIQVRLNDRRVEGWTEKNVPVEKQLRRVLHW